MKIGTYLSRIANPPSKCVAFRCWDAAVWSGASVVSLEKSSTVLLAIPRMRAAAYGEWCGWCKWMQPMKKPVHGVLWCSQLLKKNLGVPLESGLCMYVCSLKIKTVRGLLHAAVKTSRGGVFLLVHGPHGSADCPSLPFHRPLFVL